LEWHAGNSSTGETQRAIGWCSMTSQPH
jgi:hypothetical protein